MKSYTAFLDEAISARRLKELEAKGKADAAAQKMAADKLDREKATSTSNLSDQKKLQGQSNRGQTTTGKKELPTSALAIRKKPSGGAIVKKPSGGAIVKTSTTKTKPVGDEKQAGKRPRDGRPLDTPNDRPDETTVQPDDPKCPPGTRRNSKGQCVKVEGPKIRFEPGGELGVGKGEVKGLTPNTPTDLRASGPVRG